MAVDHMEGPTPPSYRTRCGQKVNSTPGYVYEYGSPNTTCKTCNRLYAADRAKNSKRIEYKCLRTDCGRSGCTSSSINNDPPEFCIYDFDEAYWVYSHIGGDE